ADLETADDQTALSVRVAFFGVLAAKELVRVGEETVKNQGKHVTQVREFVSAGTRPKIDLRSAELNLANAELALVRAKNGLDLARVGLNQAMGVEQSIDYDVAVPETAPLVEEAQPVDGLLSEALRARPEVVKIDAQLRSQEGARTVARAGFFPALVALGNLSGTKGTDSRSGDFDLGVNWFVGLGLTWNLYAGSLTLHQIAEPYANAAGLTAQRDALRQSIRADLQQQLL